MTLTTNDKKDIKEIVEEAITELANNLIKPSFEMVYKRFDEIDKKFEEHDRRFDKLDDRLDRQGKTLEYHERKIAKLEKLAPITP